jgi:hypothetical protein
VLRNKLDFDNFSDNLSQQDVELEYTPLHTDIFSCFAPFESSDRVMCAVNNSVKIFNTENGEIENDLLNPDNVTQWWAINEDQRVISWWTDSTIRMFHTYEDDISEQVAAEFKGHRLSVTAGWSSLDEVIYLFGS